MPVIQKPIIILLNDTDRLPRAVRDDAEKKHCGLRSPCSGKISLRNEWEIQRLPGEEKPGEFALKKKSQTNRKEMLTERNPGHKKWRKNSGNRLSEPSPTPLQLLKACLMTGSEAGSAAGGCSVNGRVAHWTT